MQSFVLAPLLREFYRNAASKCNVTFMTIYDLCVLPLLFSQSCPVADVLSHGLDEVVRQGLLDSLLPFLSSSNIAGGATASNTVSSTAVGSSGPSSVAVTSGGQRSAITTASASGAIVSGSAAESSSKEEEVELYRPPSDESNLTSMPASHR